MSRGFPRWIRVTPDDDPRIPRRFTALLYELRAEQATDQGNASTPPLLADALRVEPKRAATGRHA